MQIKIRTFHMVHNKGKVMVCNIIVVNIYNKVMVLIFNFSPKINKKYITQIMGTIHKDHHGVNKVHFVTPIHMLWREK